jgi:ribosomal protein L37AE/L43A
MSRHRATTVIYHCPFCAEEDLRPVAEPAGAWACQACARVFTVELVTVDTTAIPGRLAEEQALRGGQP